jgi:hypothetical protein
VGMSLEHKHDAEVGSALMSMIVMKFASTGPFLRTRRGRD